MKLKTRIMVGFLMIILVPLLLFAATLYGFSQSQSQKISKQQEISQGISSYEISIEEASGSQVHHRCCTNAC